MVVLAQIFGFCGFEKGGGTRKTAGAGRATCPSCLTQYPAITILPLLPVPIYIIR